MTQSETTLNQLAVTIDALGETMRTGFANVEQILTTKADKEDTAGIDRKIDDLREEVTGFTSDVYDELSGRVAKLEQKKA